MFALQFCVAWKITNDRYWEVIKATFCRSRVLFYLGRSSRKCHAPQFCLLGSGIAFILPTSTIIRSENILGFYTSPWSWTLGVSPLRSTNLFLTRGKVYIQGGVGFGGQWMDTVTIVGQPSSTWIDLTQVNFGLKLASIQENTRVPL